MRILGMISGTSHDGIDTAVVDFTQESDILVGRVVMTGSTPYEPELRARLVAALPPMPTTMAEVCELDTLIGQAFAAAAAEATAASGPVDLVCSHGQTVFHWVEGRRVRGTLQLGQPAWIAEAAGAAVVSDVRIRDIVRGGQGAPLVSYMDTLLLGRFGGPAAALNLGGISNATVVAPGADPYAYDIGPANALIDAAIVRAGAHPLGYDAEGAVAASGEVSDALLQTLLAEPYYGLNAPKSTGKELFTPDYIDRAIATAGVNLGTADLVATLTELTVRTVASDIAATGVETLVVSGGGYRNPVIMAGLKRELPGVSIIASDTLGAPSDAKEAIAFALIGWATLHGLPSTVPACTGAGASSILGSITPGPDGLRLPERLTAAPTALRLEGAP